MRFHKRSPLKPLLIAAIGLLVVVSIWFAMTRNRPTVTDISPAPDAFAVPAPAPLRITFDRPMDQDTVPPALTTLPARSGVSVWDENMLIFYPDTPWPHGAQISATISTAARSSSGLRLREEITWSFRTAPTLLAYLWPASLNEPVPADLYVLDPVSGEVARLTETRYGILDFFRHPNGLSILLSLSNELGGADIASLDLLTNSIQILHDCGSHLCRTPQMDPSGKWIAFENLTVSGVFIMQVDTAPVLVSTGRFPSFSSGGLILYDIETEAFVVFDPDSGDQISYPNISGEPPAWAPDGSFFLAPTFTEIGQSAFASHIFQYFKNITTPNNLTLDRLADDNAPAISPNGERIVIARRSIAPESWTPGRQIWVMQANGLNARQLTNSAVYNHTGFTWHPDNEQIAFVRSNQADLNEEPEIWLIATDGSPPIRLVINGFAPAWLP